MKIVGGKIDNFLALLGIEWAILGGSAAATGRSAYAP
jgi:hypothetical protein